MKLLRQPARLASEHEDDIGWRTEWRVPQQARCLRGEEIRFAERRQLALERFPARPHTQVDVFPVVEASALHLALIQREPERLDEMQGRTGGEAGATGVAGV